MEKTRIGFMGLGAISGIYLENITNRFPDMEVYAVCDLIPERAISVQEKYGAPRRYDTMHQLLADPNVDIVLNLTRPYEHYAVTKAALLAGKPVYSEKPLAATLAEGCNFKKATLLWLIQVVIIAISAFDILYFLGVWADAALAVRVICLIPAVWLLMSAGYLFPLQAQFENTVGNTLKNSILISIANLPVSLVVTVLNLLPVLFFFFNMELFLRTAIIWVLIGGAAIAYLNTGFLKKVFRRYMPDQEQDDGAAQSEE